MKRIFTVLAVAALMAVLVVAMGAPAFAVPDSDHCGDGDCAVGEAGTGGENSDDKAQGFRVESPSTRTPGTTVENTGNDFAGRFALSGTTDAQISGAGLVQDDNPEDDVDLFPGQGTGVPQDTQVGHGTGVFGDWAGQCALEDFDNRQC